MNYSYMRAKLNKNDGTRTEFKISEFETYLRI